MQIRRLKNEEKYDARLIAAVCFHQRIDDPDQARAECEKENDPHWGAFDDHGTLMAHMINHSYISNMDGTQIRNGGIGAVSTLPEFRETGAVRAIFQKLLSYAHKEGEVISTLYPFSHAFYRKFGYETVCMKNIYSFPPAVLKEYRFSGKVVQWKPGDSVQEWTGLYRRFAAAYNLSICRDDTMMLKRLKGEYYKDRKFAYILYEKEEPIAYLIFQDIRHDPAAIMQIEDLAWNGKSGFNALLGFLSRFTADYGTIRLPLPNGMELYSLIHSPNAYDILKETDQSYMIRAVNVQKLLQIIGKPKGTHFTIQIKDDLITENNGIWEVMDDMVVKTDKKPYLSLSVITFGQLACGSIGLDEAEYRDDVLIYDHREILRQVFVRKPILVTDHF